MVKGGNYAMSKTSWLTGQKVSWSYVPSSAKLPKNGAAVLHCPDPGPGKSWTSISRSVLFCSRLAQQKRPTQRRTATKDFLGFGRRECQDPGLRPHQARLQGHPVEKCPNWFQVSFHFMKFTFKMLNLNFCLALALSFIVLDQAITILKFQYCWTNCNYFKLW